MVLVRVLLGAAVALATDATDAPDVPTSPAPGPPDTPPATDNPAADATAGNVLLQNLECETERPVTLQDVEFDILCRAEFSFAASDESLPVVKSTVEVYSDLEGLLTTKVLEPGSYNETFRVQGVRIKELGETWVHTITVNFTQETANNGNFVLEDSFDTKTIYGWFSMIPPLVVLVFVILTRQVLIALPLAIYAGCILLTPEWEPMNVVQAFERLWSVFYVEAIADKDHAFIICFTVFLGGLVGIMNASGGTQGLANLLAGCVKSSTSAMGAAFGLGLAIFFDDYADCLISGNTFRPLMDRFHISREKFAFIVDATAAPISSIAPISSWIAFELSLIQINYIETSYFEDDPNPPDAYLTFLKTIPYRFYPIFMLWFMTVTIFCSLDFGPMLTAEKRARIQGKVNRLSDRPEEFDPRDYGGGYNEKEWEGAGGVDAAGGQPRSKLKGTQESMYNNVEQELDVMVESEPLAALAIIPVFLVIAVTMGAYFATGYREIEEGPAPRDWSLENIFSDGDSQAALLYACVIGSLVAGMLAMCCTKMSYTNVQTAFFRGVGHFMEPLFGVLVFAWCLSRLVLELSGGDYLSELIGDSLDVRLLPMLSFLLSGLIAIITGTSWGTMSTMFPYIIPLAQRLSNNDPDIMLSVIGTLLAGSVWGDHCSPISDTTVLSSMACGCELTDHVKTQLPYASFVAFFSVLCGDLAVAYIDPAYSWAGYAIGIPVMTVAIWLVGTKVPAHRDGEPLEKEEDFIPGVCSPNGYVFVWWCDCLNKKPEDKVDSERAMVPPGMEDYASYGDEALMAQQQRQKIKEKSALLDERDAIADVNGHQENPPAGGEPNLGPMARRAYGPSRFS